MDHPYDERSKDIRPNWTPCDRCGKKEPVYWTTKTNTNYCTACFEKCSMFAGKVIKNYNK